MTDLSIIIPARNEEFLQNTIDNVLKGIRGDTELIVILDGYWPDQPIPQHERVNIIHYEEPIGQRAAVNKGAEMSSAKFIMKLDAHCAVDTGFDIKLMADCEYEDTVIPAMFNLHAFNWKCERCGEQTYQGPQPKACKCGNKKFRKKIIWKPKTNPRSEFYRFDTDMKFKYWRAFKKRPEAKPALAPTLGNLGACFFMHRQRFFDLGGMDEGHGGWGQLGTEVSCKAWLSGGRQLTNKNTWFSHMFRTGGGFGFPYQISGRQVKKARKHSQDIWLNDKWEGAKHSLEWLINKFAPVPEWENYVFKGGKADQGVKMKSVSYTPSNPVVPSTVATPTKGCVYYTHHRCEETILSIARTQLKRCTNGMPITSVSLLPLDFGDNIVLNEQPSVLTMFMQILKGLESIDTDVVFLTEHDVIYHPSHFDFVPPKSDVFYYNQNVWHVDAKNGQALFYYSKQTSGVCGYREMMIDHYKNRVERVRKEGFTRRMGYEPGTHKFPRGFDYYTSDAYMSEHPNVDIRHKFNLTGKRFRKEQYRRQPKGWRLEEKVPFWGKTRNNFYNFLFGLRDE